MSTQPRIQLSNRAYGYVKMIPSVATIIFAMLFLILFRDTITSEGVVVAVAIMVVAYGIGYVRKMLAALGVTIKVSYRRTK